MKLSLRITTLLPLTFLIAGIIGCNLPVGPATPTIGPESIPTVVFTEEALQSFETKLGDLVANGVGPFSITFTEDELGAVICRELERAKAEGAEIPISNMGVAMGDDMIQVTGKLDIPGVNATGYVTIIPAISADGLLDLQVTRVEFGFISFEPEVITDLTGALETSINNYLLTDSYRVTLTDIVITDTDITLNGTING